jgi:hypothetical protein
MTTTLFTLDHHHQFADPFCDMALVQQVTLWYHVLGQRSYNRVTIPSNETIAALRKKIYAEIRHQAGCDVGQLILTQVRYIMISVNTRLINGFLAHNISQVDVDLKSIREQITAGEYRSVFNKQSLFPDDRISGVWPETPVHGRLHIFVSLPVGKRSSSSVYSGECFIRLYFALGLASLASLLNLHWPSPSPRCANAY